MSPGGLLSAATGAWEPPGPRLEVPGLEVPWVLGAGAEALVVPATGVADPEFPQAASAERRPAAVRAMPSRRASVELLLSGMPRFLPGGR